MKPVVRSIMLFFAALFLGGAAFAWFDVITHENMLVNPELRLAAGWSVTGLMFLGFGLRRRRRSRPESESRATPTRPRT